MANDIELTSDRQLVDATRAGQTPAWEMLRARHERVVGGVAAERDDRDAIESAFHRLHEELLAADREPEDPSFAVRAVRPRVLALMTGGTYGPTAPGAAPDDDERSGSNGPSLSELERFAVAFGSLPDGWQTALWHRRVDLEPAATVARVLGRSPADAVAVVAVAEAGLFEAYLAVEIASDHATEDACAPIVALLGAFRRGTLPPGQQRMVEAHLGSVDDEAPSGCAACERRLELAAMIPMLVPRAIVPGLTGLSVERYRAAVGAAGVMGVSALAARQSVRANRWARAAAVAAVVVALLGAALIIRDPIGDLTGEIADLIDRSTTPTTESVPTTPPTTTSRDGGAPERMPSRIELVFPGAPQGLAYVPGGPSTNLGVSLSTPAPVYRNGTGTIDAAITNQADVASTVQMIVRPSAGVSFDALTGGPGSCAAGDDAGAVCLFDLEAGGVAPVSLRFGLDETVADRLVVVSSVRAPKLDLPVVTVPDLVVGAVVRGGLTVIGNTLGDCEPTIDPCPPRGEPASSDAELELGDGVSVEQAILVWEGRDAAPNRADEVGLIVPGGTDATAVGADVSTPLPADVVGFRSHADVTDLVAAAGGGVYGLEQPEGFAGDGSWTLLVVTSHADADRRLVVLIDPASPPTLDSAVSVTVPIGSAGPGGNSDPSIRAGRLWVRTPASIADDRVEVTVDGDAVEADPVDGGAPPDTYALVIDTSADVLMVEVSTSTRPVAVTTIGLAIDIVS